MLERDAQGGTLDVYRLQKVKNRPLGGSEKGDRAGTTGGIRTKTQRQRQNEASKLLCVKNKREIREYLNNKMYAIQTHEIEKNTFRI